MKALSVKQPWASWIANGQKTIETRRWFTAYRGPLLICSSRRPDKTVLPYNYQREYPLGKALCIAELVNCRPMTEADCEAAMCYIYPGAFSWIFENIRPVEPFDVKGKLGLFEVPLIAEAV